MPIRFWKWLLAAALAVCVGTPALAQPAKKPSGGSATIIVTRKDEMMARLATAKVEVNEQPFASLDRGQRHVGTVRPGPAVISVSHWSNPGRFIAKFNAQPGRTYRFQVSARTAHIPAGVMLGMTGILIDAAVNKDKGGEFEIHPVK